MHVGQKSKMFSKDDISPWKKSPFFVSLGIPVVPRDQDFSNKIFKFCFSKPFHRNFDDVTTL